MLVAAEPQNAVGQPLGRSAAVEMPGPFPGRHMGSRNAVYYSYSGRGFAPLAFRVIRSQRFIDWSRPPGFNGLALVAWFYRLRQPYLAYLSFLSNLFPACKTESAGFPRFYRRSVFFFPGQGTLV